MSSSQMSEFIRNKDWTKTPLGDRSLWPPWLKTAVQIILDSKYPMFIWWGKHLINVYNDAYIPMLGNRHPNALGESAPKIWPDIWDVVGVQARMVFQEGRATWNEKLPLFLTRNGFLEETFFTFSYSPIRNEEGNVLGLFCACTEETSQALKGRRLNTLRQISMVTERSDTVSEVCRLSAEVLTENPYDIPFSLLYVWSADERQLCLSAHSGLEPDTLQVPRRLAWDGNAFHPQPWWPAVLSPMRKEEVFSIAPEMGFLRGVWPESCTSGIVLPLPSWEREKKSGYLIVGISPRLSFDERYREFLNLLANSIAGSINRAQSLTEERKRNAILAELNRAKTEFFSNVSHEFRTPLTLILGSLEEAMKANPETLPTSPALKVAHRNACRMLKLVNVLLDFSSLEAGRMQAEFEPVDLSQVTKDLASCFESAMRKGGLEFIVACPPLPQPVYVDRNAWEKIILNLLSNALKFTRQGQVIVEIRQTSDAVHVSVRDSGVGIPREALPRIFERFFRVKEVLGRTFEGTGIGLSLVKELVHLHGGNIHVDSELERGSEFTITLPFGFRHLPAHQVRHTSTQASDGSQVQPFLLEIDQWPVEPLYEKAHEVFSHAEHDQSSKSDTSRPVIVLVEDNRDLRDYVSRLLAAEYDVVQTSDGQEALTVAQAIHPDLILSDVMMPQMDGCELLKCLRAHKELQTIPFILISARAGQEAEVEGLQTGADDYLVKPFTAKELLARIRKTLGLASLRRTAVENESRFQQLAHHPEAMTWLTDTSGNCIFLSQTWCDFTGQTEEAGLGKGWLDAVHPDDRAATTRKFQETNHNRSRIRLEYRLRRADGRYSWVLDSASPRVGPNGKYAGHIGLVLDLSSQKEIEEKIRDSEAQFRTLANTISQFVWMADSTGSIFWYNQRWFDYTGTTRDDMKGWGWRSVHHPDHVERVVQKISHCFQTGQIWEDTFPLRSRTGEYRWFLSRAVPIRDQSGKVIRWMGTNTDITELQQTKEQLQDLTTELENRIAERTRELEQNRQRLQALAGDLTLTEQRERRQIAEELHDFLAQHLVACRLKVNQLQQTIETEGGLQVLQEMDRILDQSLTYTRSLVAQLIPPVLYQFGLLEALRWLAQDMMKHHTISVEIQMERDHLRLAENEAVLLYQSIRELMMNVVKHAGTDRLYLTITCPSPTDVCIEVRDHGVGFDPHTSYEKSQHSNQFGLFSIRERMALLGGRLVVDSNPGSVTSVRVLVPIPDQDPAGFGKIPHTIQAPGSPEGLSGSPVKGLRRFRVILADDHAVVRQGLRSLLESFPDVHIVGEAADGLEAIRLTESLSPDVVVMDVNMPRLDGIEATKQICHNRSNVLVIGLSFRQDTETEQAMRAAGAVGYLTKESAGQELYQVLSTIVGQYKPGH